MKYREAYSLANDCTEIEYWKELGNISILPQSLLVKSYSIRGKNRFIIPLSRINLVVTRPITKNSSIKQMPKVTAIPNRGV